LWRFEWVEFLKLRLTGKLPFFVHRRLARQ
jgi:hypothetical protein